MLKYMQIWPPEKIQREDMLKNQIPTKLNKGKKTEDQSLNSIWDS